MSVVGSILQRKGRYSHQAALIWGLKRVYFSTTESYLSATVKVIFFFLAGTGMETKRPSHMHESRGGERHGDDGCQVRVKGRSGAVGCTKMTGWNFYKCTRTFQPPKKMFNFGIFAFVRLLSRSSDLLPLSKDTHTRFIS